jgi:5'-nucleotidase
MRFLLTNDDGIEAPGLRALEDAARQLGDVLVAAPASPQSGCGHRVTTDAPLRLQRLAADRVAVFGTPADCVRLALFGLLGPFDWVLSGVNAGGNLGADVYHSGTVAAVREAALHGRPGVALSQYRRRDLPDDWDATSRRVAGVLRLLLAQAHPAGVYWNVNLPHAPPGAAAPEVVFCPLELAPLPLSYRSAGDAHRYNGDYHRRARTVGSDVDVCFGGNIAVTQLILEGAERAASAVGGDRGRGERPFLAGH